MEPEIDEDEDDLRSLSERILPLTSASYTNNNISPRNNNNNRIRSLKPQKSISFDNQFYHEETSLPTTVNTGDIIQMSDGTRKKYNGSSWRRMCSKPNCTYYTQSQGLCKPHLAASKKRKITKIDNELPTMIDQTSFDQEEPKKGDIIILSNGIRKKYDGRQYRRICANSNCTAVVHGSLEYQNGLCPYHFQEIRSKPLNQFSPLSKSDQEPFIEPRTPPKQTVISSSSRKRPRPNSPPSRNPSQSSTSDIINKSSVPKPNRRLSIAVIPPTVDIEHPNKGDIIEMENGSRKKFDGVVWRTICSMPGCFIAAQRDELCRKHFIKLNGKPNSAPTMAMNMMSSGTMLTPRANSTSSTDEKLDDQNSKMGKDLISNVKDESLDYDYNQQEETNNDNISNSYSVSDDDAHIKEEISSPIEDDNLGTHIDHTLINALSASREKFPTTYLKKWLREHRSHPYPSNQEKIQLAKQSSITYDQVTTWFNNARAILRRRQAKLQHSFDPVADDNDNDNDNDNDHDNDTDDNHRLLSLFNGVSCRSIGIQCNPSTVDQTTLTSTKISVMTDDELTSDRTIKILTPSSRVLTTNNFKKTNSHEFLINGIKTEDDYEREKDIIITSTCLDDDQMSRLKEFCSKFQIELSNSVDENTTHLITDEEEGETLVCPLSKKVIQAVARHMYVVTYRWIDDCLKSNQLINEKPYEIQGDLTLSSDHNGMQRSRQSILPENLPKNLLLENFSVMLKCNGCQEMMNNDELIELVQLSGAKHTTDSHFSRLQTHITRIVLCEKEYLINRREMYEKCIHSGIHFLTPEWFLESLVQYRIQPFQEYQISP
ncbi:unnamed protein product [Adineta steineri]|uniref:Uncharacterized protein n=1 Tax=Adineta steineri TaxID=433720 RepID=A0A814YY25_9BILA|nr:unnamed protein product [Adineta steineri]CAF1235043.1 unnamed protein product [Adineta steineri]